MKETPLQRQHLHSSLFENKKFSVCMP